MKHILRLIIVLLLVITTSVSASDKNLVNIYLFHSNTCSHCREAIRVLDELENKYDNIKVYKYEVSESENSALLSKVGEIYDVKVNSVPFTIIGNKTFSGFSYTDTKRSFMGAINYYSTNGYIDEIAKLKEYEQPTLEIDENRVDIDAYLNNYGTYTFKLPIIGEVSTNNISINTTALLMGAIDGFNYNSLLVLLFFIMFLLSIKDKRKMIILSTCFILSSFISNFIFMLIPNLNISNNLVYLILTIIIISSILLIGKKDKDISISKQLIGLILITSCLNLIEITTSSSISDTFKEILKVSDINIIENIIYNIVYNFMYIIDEFIIFLIILLMVKETDLTDKQRYIFKILGSIVLIGISLYSFIKMLVI